LLGACAQIGSTPADLIAKATPDAAAKPVAPVASAATSTPAAALTTGAAKDDGRAALARATEYWGKAFSDNARDPQIGLNYARNLKALGEKQQALMVLQQANALNSAHRGVAGEYGRLALEFEQITLAEKLLEQADDPANPDWKIISARGAALAKQNRYREAIPLFERALALAPDQASVLSNLAMAHMMVGDAEKAEPLLKRAVATGRGDPRLNQNLALALSVQGKYDEAKLIAATDLPPDRASANVDYVKSMVQLAPKPLTVAKAPEKPADELKGSVADRTTDSAGWSTKVAATKP
jgi:Flp pilus assembly protein TadD